VRPIRIFQALPRACSAARRFGRLRTALLGVLCHLAVATLIVAVYVVASRKIEILRRQPIAAGMAYGVVAWLVMN
jgi:hypothetical protein